MHPLQLAVSRANYPNLAQFPAISVNLPARSYIRQILLFRIAELLPVQVDGANVPQSSLHKKKATTKLPPVCKYNPAENIHQNYHSVWLKAKH